jgi:hypothetical protein
MSKERHRLIGIGEQVMNRGRNMNSMTRPRSQGQNAMISGIRRTRMFRGVVLTLLIPGLGALASAQDLSDDDVCMACHAAFEWSAPENSDRPRVHNDDGTFIQQSHEMWSCTNCHEDIIEIPHRVDTERTVDCLACHDAVPQK